MSLLPTPPGYVPPDYTPEQQARYDEVDQYLLNLWAGYNIVEATQGYTGDIYYWVDNDTLPPPYQPAVPWMEQDLIPPPGTGLGGTELELYSELRGRSGTTPIQRPDFSNYIMGLTGATSVQDYLENYRVPGLPADAYRLYAGLVSKVPNMGASANINQFQGDVELGTFTLIEIAVVCKDGAPKVGGWDDDVPGFIPYRDRPYGPGGVVPASVLGNVQHENRIDIFQSAGGDWWIAHNGNLLGYYPASLFSMLDGWACEAHWYAEVFDPTPGTWTWTDVGSGEPLTAGFPRLAYVRNPVYRDIFSFAAQTPLDLYYSVPTVPACYERSPLKTELPPWDHSIDLSGPGGDATACKHP